MMFNTPEPTDEMIEDAAPLRRALAEEVSRALGRPFPVGAQVQMNHLTPKGREAGVPHLIVTLPTGEVFHDGVKQEKK